MNVFGILMFFISLAFYEGRSEETYEIDLEPHLAKLQGMRHPQRELNQNRIEARDYIKEKFETYNLTTQFQKFTSKVSIQNSISEVDGWNIIAESSSSNPDAPIILICTYYDNSRQWNPLIETGASVASMLETARIFHMMELKEEADQAVTLLFVAFDLNVKNYEPFVVDGQPGSEIFVQKWLLKSSKKQNILGVIFLDSIAAFNEEKDTQKVPGQIKESFPSAYNMIKNSGFKGDFLTAMFTNSNMKLADTFCSVFEKISVGTSFQAIKIGLPDNSNIDQVWSTPLFDFWTSASIPVMRLSDMVEGRTDPLSRQISNYELKDFWEGKRKQFVETTTLALINLMLKYSQDLKDNKTLSPMEVTSEGIPTMRPPDIPNDNSSSKTKLDECLLMVAFSVITLCSFQSTLSRLLKVY